MLALLCFVAWCIAYAACEECPTTDYSELEANQAAFGGSRVIPQVIPEFCPEGYLHTIFKNIDIGGAQQLAPDRVALPPSLFFNHTGRKYDDKLPSRDTKYLLAMIDPDAPNPKDPSWSPILHWMVTDLQIQYNQLLSLQHGTEVAPYARPNPPPTGGTHRYVILLYVQPDDFKLPEVMQNMPTKVEKQRKNFDFAGFLKDTGIGNPVGGNFFKSTYDGKDVEIPKTYTETATLGGAPATNTAAGTKLWSQPTAQPRLKFQKEDGHSGSAVWPAILGAWVAYFENWLM